MSANSGEDYSVNYCLEVNACQLGYSSQKNPLINHLNLRIEYGEWLVVVGANGCGKTTLLRNILGLEKPLAGELFVLGKSAHRGNNQIGYVSQWREVNSILTLRADQFVASMVQGWRYGLPILSKKQKQRVETCMQEVGASEFCHKPFASLSGGQKQRLHLAQALVDKPRLLLLDEPLTHLDLLAQKDFLSLLFTLQQQHRMTIIMVTHGLSEVFPYANQILSLDEKPYQVVHCHE